MQKRMNLLPTLAIWIFCLCPDMAQARTTEKKSSQTVCLSETDPNSPRHSKLAGTDTSSAEVHRTDVDKDGDPDLVESWWNGKRVRWFDENDNMLATDVMGDRSEDSLQIDRDGDSYYDGPDDMNVDYVDDEGDGRAELEVVAMNPRSGQNGVYAGESHFMIFEDVDKDGVFGCINWETFKFECWGVHEKDPNFKPDYNGDSIFLKEHMPAWSLADARYNWENPFAFYDFDGDGCTEMAIRLCDNRERDKGVTTDVASWKYDGKIDDSYVTWDLDNDTNRGNELDYDMTLRFAGGEKLDYNGDHNRHPKLKAPQWVLPFFRYTNWREIDDFIYVPHAKCYEQIFKPQWGNCWLTFDEDDDDHRWERVELYYPERDGQRSDPYSLQRSHRTVKKDKATSMGLNNHIQSDSLGDRGEYDMDNSGRAKLYVGKWDKKIHLHGAEWGAWTVDYQRRYWGGAGPARGNATKDQAPKVEEVVQYSDTNNNGYIDEILYDYDGDRQIDLKVSLLDPAYGGEAFDETDLIDPSDQEWAGMNNLFNRIAEESWQEALLLYRAAWKKGLNDAELDDLAIAASSAEKHQHGYWLKEKLFRLMDKKLSGESEVQAKLRKLYFTGDIGGVADLVSEREWK